MGRAGLGAVHCCLARAAAARRAHVVIVVPNESYYPRAAEQGFGLEGVARDHFDPHVPGDHASSAQFMSALLPRPAASLQAMPTAAAGEAPQQLPPAMEHDDDDEYQAGAQPQDYAKGGIATSV